MTRLTPEQHTRAAGIRNAVLAVHTAIPPAHLYVLDWSHGHERRSGGECYHCHSPALTNLVDDRGRPTHKACAEVADYLAGPPPEPVGGVDTKTGADTAEPVAPAQAVPRRAVPYRLTDGCEVCGGTLGQAIYPTTGVRCRQHAPTID